MKDHSYVLGKGRNLYTYPWMRSRNPIRRCSTTFTLTVTGAPFRLTTGNETNTYQAVAVRAGIRRACYLEEGGGIGFQLYPSHPDFPRFRSIAAPGAMAIDRKLFHRFDDELDLAYRGKLPFDAACDLFDNVLQIVLSQIPRIRRPDERINKVVDLLKANPQFPLEQLAESIGLSYFRLSHLFKQEIGIPLRSYQLWRKVDTAMNLLSVMRTTEAAHVAGFADCAHLFRAFQELHAASPSYFMNGKYVKVIAPCRADPREAGEGESDPSREVAQVGIAAVR